MAPKFHSLNLQEFAEVLQECRHEGLDLHGGGEYDATTTERNASAAAGSSEIESGEFKSRSREAEGEEGGYKI